MISRRTAQALGNLFAHVFRSYNSGSRHTSPYYTAAYTSLYDFLYANDYEAYLMNIAKAIRGDTREVAEFVIRLHTGETIVSATKAWDWQKRQLLGNRLLQGLAEDILQTVPVSKGYSGSWDKDERQDQLRAELVSRLELDGYTFKDKRLLFSEAAVLDTEEEEGVLQHLMVEVGLPDLARPRHHLEKTAEHYMAGRWDDCISNARKVLESVLSQVAQIHSTKILKAPLPQQKLDKPFEVRDYLERENLLEAKEKKALAEVYGLLSNTGGHPYIAQKDQARLMRHLALTFTQFALLRLQGSMQPAGTVIT